jgi:hypothetical protein
MILHYRNNGDGDVATRAGAVGGTKWADRGWGSMVGLPTEQEWVDRRSQRVSAAYYRRSSIQR